MLSSKVMKATPPPHDISPDPFALFFQGEARRFLVQAVVAALAEDGPDLTSRAIFSPEDRLTARIVAKEASLVAGLPITEIILERLGMLPDTVRDYPARDGQSLAPGDVAAVLKGPARGLLKAERVILNFLCHLSGIANLTARYVAALAGTKTRLLDTRKTLPGLRYPEKYAVLVGGGLNHRRDLAEMLMLKDNHLDRAGGIAQAVAALRLAFPHGDMPPLEIECRDLDEVRQALAQKPQRIMFDNMGPEEISQALKLVPPGVETEISGGVSLESLPKLAGLGADFISVGRITHSAAYADFSMQLILDTEQPC